MKSSVVAAFGAALIAMVGASVVGADAGCVAFGITGLTRP